MALRLQVGKRCNVAPSEKKIPEPPLQCTCICSVYTVDRAAAPVVLLCGGGESRAEAVRGVLLLTRDHASNKTHTPPPHALCALAAPCRAVPRRQGPRGRVYHKTADISPHVRHDYAVFTGWDPL